MEKPSKLYVVLDRAATKRGTSEALLDVFEQACAAGATLFWWRDRGAQTISEYWETLARGAVIATTWGVKVLVRNRADIARALALEGVHHSADGIPRLALRRCVGRDGTLATSVHNTQEALDARGVDLMVLSPIYKTTSKPMEREALGVEVFEQAWLKKVTAKVYALGGVSPERASACVEAGAYGVAVMGGICGAEDPFEATRAYLSAVGEE